MSRELELIALAARGALPVERLDAIPEDAFSTAPRLFAWTCATRACRLLGARSTFAAVRLARVMAPRLAMPLEVWAELCRETDVEIDAAEQLDGERQRQARRDG